MHIQLGCKTDNRSDEYIKYLQKRANGIRIRIIQMLANAGSGHAAGSLDLADLIACLYFGITQYNPTNPNDNFRDLLVLSNGHTCPVLYAGLAEAGLITGDELMTLRKFGSRLQGHPERIKLPWLETTSGPLGEGLSQAAGMAYYLRYLAEPNDRMVYCIVGDGELNEGEIAEAMFFAGKYHLSNLMVFVDNNRIQLSGTTEQILPMNDLNSFWQSAGWGVYQVNDGNDVRQILDCYDKAIASTKEPPYDLSKPNVIILNTTPGKGISFMENDYHWHGKVPTQAEAEQAIAELRSNDV